MVATTWSRATWSAGRTERVTTPSLGAVIRCSIFMASIGEQDLPGDDLVAGGARRPRRRCRAWASAPPGRPGRSPRVRRGELVGSRSTRLRNAELDGDPWSPTQVTGPVGDQPQAVRRRRRAERRPRPGPRRASAAWTSGPPSTVTVVRRATDAAPRRRRPRTGRAGDRPGASRRSARPRCADVVPRQRGRHDVRRLGGSGAVIRGHQPRRAARCRAARPARRGRPAPARRNSTLVRTPRIVVPASARRAGRAPRRGRCPTRSTLASIGS